MANPNESFAKTPQSFGTKSAAVTPGAVDLDPIPKSVVCLTTGNITVVPVNNDNAVTLSFVGVPAGYVVPFQVRRVTAATAVVYTISD